MEPRQTSQVAVAGLIFALLSFVYAVFAGVYMLAYKKSDSTSQPPTTMYRYAPPPSMYRAAPPAQASLSASFSQPPPQPMTTPPVQTLSGAYAAPRIPSTVRSGTVGTFFEDELPQA